MNASEPRHARTWEVANQLERYYTVFDVAARWRFKPDTVRRIFLQEPGVLIISRPRRGTRIYRNLRIPESVLLRVEMRLRRVA